VTNSSIRVQLVEDHAIVREGLRMLLSEESDIEVVGEARDGAESVQLAAMLQPHVILMDLVMPGMDGIHAIQDIRLVSPSSQVVVLTSFGDDQRVRDAIQAGAIGYLLKDVLKADLFHAIRAAAQGQPTLHPEAQRQLMRQVTTPPTRSLIDDLTPRERDVLRLIVQGQSNKEIAASLRVTEGTVKGHVSAILSKLGVADRTQAALYAVKHGFETVT
jgi:two-component system, NarL family, response regulator LiaR